MLKIRLRNTKKHTSAQVQTSSLCTAQNVVRLMLKAKSLVCVNADIYLVDRKSNK